MPRQPKDNFSAQAPAYAQYRPRYPQELYEFLFNLPGPKDTAWDCGTGNGQVAAELAEKYTLVYGTDVSQAQLQLATQAANIHYLVCPAENTPLADASVDLVTVAQAVHWFDFEKFRQEVRRVAKPGAWVAFWGYGLLQIEPKIDKVISHFYNHTIGDYWDPERRYLDEAYESIPFPYHEAEAPNFSIRLRWTLAHFIGYLSSWSSVKHYERKHGVSPLPDLEQELLPLWPEQEHKEIFFPVFLRVGQLS